MSSGESPGQMRKHYDDISYQKRKKLIYLINQEKWTIRAAAQQIGIKHCTAKHILYLYRNQGKIYRKKGGKCSTSRDTDDDVDDRDPANVVYVFCPYYIFCYPSPETVPINLEHFQKN